MMQATFVGHSGFLLETDSAYLLFDWWKGTLPPLENREEKPFFVFASHAHSDHYNPEIFALNADFYALGFDIPVPSDSETATKCTLMKANQTYTLSCREVSITVETLSSTDEGVAFLVTVDGSTIYHAGDLNWWHWEGEPDPWNPDMAGAFKAAIAPLSGRHLDVAFAPLDSRLGDAFDWGLLHLLEIATVDAVIPMHQWRKFSATDAFCELHPNWKGIVHGVSSHGQVVSL